MRLTQMFFCLFVFFSSSGYTGVEDKWNFREDFNACL